MCFEMLIVAIAHDKAYSEYEFIKSSATKDKTNPYLLRVLGSALSPRATFYDIYNTFSPIDEKVKYK